MKRQSKRFRIYYLTFITLLMLSIIGLVLSFALECPYYLIPMVLLVIFTIIGLNNKVNKWLRK